MKKELSQETRKEGGVLMALLLHDLAAALFLLPPLLLPRLLISIRVTAVDSLAIAPSLLSHLHKDTY